MPRLSIKEQRAKEIINAFERCIASNGISGAQLEKIAAESGIQRPALRHFIGNRDRLILELTRSIAEEYKQMFSSAEKLMNTIGRTPENLLIVLFMQTRLTSAERIIVLTNLYSVAKRYPEVKKELNKWYLNIIKWVVKQLSLIKPKASKDELEKVAIALVSISFNFASMTPLAIKDNEYNTMLSAGKKLIENIKG